MDKAVEKFLLKYFNISQGCFLCTVILKARINAHVYYNSREK